jgi:hypothetical protein
MQVALLGTTHPSAEAHMPDIPVVIKIADDQNRETFQINHERYLSSVRVPEREQDQTYVATESWITFDEEGIRAELAQTFGIGGPERLLLIRHERNSGRRTS